jgi:predicted Ser/Thr protein kinase
MDINNTLSKLYTRLNEKELFPAIPFRDFLEIIASRPQYVFRNIFQLFSDMITYYVDKEEKENIDDPELVNFIKYNSTRLFVAGSDMPFIADLPFANRLVNLAKSFRSGAQQNKIYIFEGPTGCGKSTFLNNLLSKLEEYTGSEHGLTYEITWKIDKKKLFPQKGLDILIGDSLQNFHLNGFSEKEENSQMMSEIKELILSPEPLEVHCPSHDNPILIIPKKYRKDFFEDLITDDEFNRKLFNRKEYEWIFKDDVCTICSSLYKTLFERLGSMEEVLNMVFVKKAQFNRRLGEGISVFNPGDLVKKEAHSNQMLQTILNNILKDSNAVRYVFSSLARTNNGIYAIMDVKSHNKDRLLNLHGIISDSIHKVEHIEERINSLFIALMNPEDKEVVESVKSLGDRIMRIPIPYILDFKTEVEIYYQKFGREIENKFLPRVLENFAKVVISSRINPESESLKNWITHPGKYSKYCDKNLLLLKMELYSGHLPAWISEDDRKSYDRKRRRAVISESEKDGQDETSITGRQSIEIFNEFFAKYSKEGSLIDMSMVYKFFNDNLTRFKKIPEGFLDSLVTLYDYNVLQEIKECLYSYNEKEISNDILNYMFALNFEIGSKEKCIYTGMVLEINEEFLKRIEQKLIQTTFLNEILEFRKYVQREYTSNALTREMGVEKKRIQDTKLYKLLLDKYQYNLKENVLQPFLQNDNFRNAIKDYATTDFRSYDKNIIKDVRFLITNLASKYKYNEEGAQQVCIYIIDNKVPEKFSKN